MGATKIEWADAVWNPITGCSKVSEGCRNCYAERMAKRLAGRYGYPKDEPFKVTFHPERLEEPLRWRKPKRIFVCSMGDLFHGNIYDRWVHQIFSVIINARQHQFYILTKRPWRISQIEPPLAWPQNLGLGVSIENQPTAEERIPMLLKIPAAKHIVSIEPTLEKVYLWNAWLKGNSPLSWIILGCETGPGARPMQVDWAREIRDRCQMWGVPLFIKQLTINGKPSKHSEEWSQDLRVREYPK